MNKINVKIDIRIDDDKPVKEVFEVMLNRGGKRMTQDGVLSVMTQFFAEKAEQAIIENQAKVESPEPVFKWRRRKDDDTFHLFGARIDQINDEWASAACERIYITKNLSAEKIDMDSDKCVACFDCFKKINTAGIVT